MQCNECKYYKSGQYSNYCDLFQMENFRIYTADNPCTEIDKDYIFQEDFEPFGMFKGKSADDYIEQRHKEEKKMDNRMENQKTAALLKQELKGCVFKHFKGNNYVVTDIAVHSETEDLYVVYQSMPDRTKTWIRPYDMFTSEVDKEKYPDVTQVMRFERTGEVIDL